jgi:hypothetical protein
MSKKKGLELDTQKIISWCKSNVVFVILIAVCIVAMVGLPMIAQGWTEKVEQALKQRAGNFKKLDKLQATSVTPPGSTETAKVAVNQDLLDTYIEVTEKLRVEAEEVIAKSLELNKKNYGVLSTELFPAPPSDQRETLPQQFFRLLESEYKTIMQKLNAGAPITADNLVVYLEDARVHFMETSLSTKHNAELTKEQRSSLEKHLSERRMFKLRTNAKDISIYFDDATLNIPEFDIRTEVSVGTLFTWQWRYWVVADILGAVSSMNDEQTVLTSPIKQVVMLEVLGIPTISEEEKSGSGRGGGGGGSAGPKPGGPSGGGDPRGGGPRGGNPRGGGPRGGDPRGGDPRGGDPRGGGRPGPGPSGPSGNSQPPSRDGQNGSFAQSQTGRKSGELFDVIQIRIKMIVDTQRIPTILDGFSSYNFYTVIDLDLQPEDKFVALGDGYDYGSASVSEMTLVLESVWLRAWTTEYMPSSVKKAIGIKVNTNE